VGFNRINTRVERDYLVAYFPSFCCIFISVEAFCLAGHARAAAFFTVIDMIRIQAYLLTFQNKCWKDSVAKVSQDGFSPVRVSWRIPYLCLDLPSQQALPCSGRHL
jgi:hypothetical protein